MSYGWPGAVDALAHWLTLLSLRSFLFCFTNTLFLYFVLKMLSNSIIHPFVHQLTHCCQKTFHLAHSKAKTLSHLLSHSSVAIFFALEECDWAEWLFEAALKSDGKAPG